MHADDMRLINFGPGLLVGVYNKLRPKGVSKCKYHNDIFIVELKGELSSSELRVTRPPIMVSMESEMGIRPQKNWSPFVYHPERASLRDEVQTQYSTFNLPPLLFVYSVYPHRIIGYNVSSFVENPAVISMMTVAETTVNGARSIDDFWAYGTPRGGTCAEIVETPMSGKST
jgi:hypothetical protein